MKTIKFRQRLKKHFWHNDEKFHYWGYIDNSFVSPMGKNETVGDSEQFIGNVDENGIDIYEGDIVELTTNLDFGDYDDGERKCVFQVDAMESALFDDCVSGGPDGCEHFVSCIVLGNIHDNKDLLP